MALLGRLVEDHDCSPNVLFLATYRTDVKLIKSFFWKLLDHWRDIPHLNVTDIALPNLAVDDIHQMLSDSLQLVHHETQALRDLLYEISTGNPTLLKELLRIMQRSYEITPDPNNSSLEYQATNCPS